jgi:hypothetical protein
LEASLWIRPTRKVQELGQYEEAVAAAEVEENKNV